MRLVGASKVFVCDEDFCVIHRGGMVFDQKILALGPYDDLKKTYPKIESTFYENAVLLPTFANPHVHFEFCANESSFLYGGFDRWLTSVMAKRDDVVAQADLAMQKGILEQLGSGVGAVGAISSYGDDLEILACSDLKVVYFNEALGSNPGAIDFLYHSFKKRLEDSMHFQSRRFTPAVAVHSPYSVHFVMAKKVLELARSQNLATSVHFLESHFEREWLESQSGWFKKFYTQTLKVSNPRALYSITDFLELFEGLDTLFVHALFATKSEYQSMQKTGTIITCPRSNRLLNNRLLDLEALDLNQVAVATDGKSSNANLNFLEELRAMLFGYDSRDCAEFAKVILKMATRSAHAALRMDSGILQEGRSADFCIFEIEGIEGNTQEALQFLLHARQAKEMFIDGCQIHLPPRL